MTSLDYKETTFFSTYNGNNYYISMNLYILKLSSYNKEFIKKFKLLHDVFH